MFRRLFVCMTVLGCLLLLFGPQVWAQGCYPGNTPTLAVSSVNLLTPSQAAALGYTTVTVTTQTTLPGDVTSKSITVTKGTTVSLAWFSYNADSAASYFTVDSDATHQSPTNQPLNNNISQWWTPDATWIGHTVHQFITATRGGRTTQDVVNVTVVDGTQPALLQRDNISSNAYHLVSTTYSGNMQISSIDCPHMLTAHHTPTATIQLQSDTDGQHAIVRGTGTAVTGVTGLYATVTDIISTNVGDNITASFGGFAYCDLLIGNIFQGLTSFRVEYARVVVKDLGHPPRPGSEKPVPSVIYDVAPICDNDSDPADWQPTVVHSWSSRHAYWWGVTSLFRWPDLPGVQWIPVASYLSDIGGLQDPAGGPWALVDLVIVGGAVPYPAGNGPYFPVPGKCTRFVGFDSHTGKAYYNVLYTFSSSQIPWWPFPQGSNN